MAGVGEPLTILTEAGTTPGAWTATVQQNRRRVQRPLGAWGAEWWRRSPAGLEQGWELYHEPPDADGGVWSVNVAFEGAAVDVAGPTVAELTHDGRRLAYQGLLAWDAAGRTLDASFEQTGPDALRISVDLRDAVFPVTVDPVLGVGEWTFEPPNARLGGGTLGRVGDTDGDGLDELFVGDGATAVWVLPGTVDGPATEASWSLWESSAGSGIAGGDFDGDGYADLAVGVMGTTTSAGVVRVFRGGPAGLSQPEDQRVGQGPTGWGGSLATFDVQGDGFDDLVVGRRVDSFDTGAGQVSLYLGGPSGLSETADWTYVGPSDWGVDHVVNAGDLDGDGDEDLVVAAQGDVFTSRGAQALVFLGNGSDFEASPSSTLPGGAAMGLVVGAAGDLDGDGYSDLALGQQDGRVRLHMGSVVGPDLLPADVRSGRAAVSPGDVNGDGYDDLLVGVATLPTYGRADLYVGGPTGLGLGSVWSTYLHQPPAAAFDMHLAPGLAGVGDTDGDGFVDVLVAEPEDDRVRWYQGSELGLSGDVAVFVSDGPIPGSFANRMLGVGDMNGDGYGELFVASDHAGASVFSEGRVQAYAGSATGLDPDVLWQQEGAGTGAAIGSDLASGDADDDGWPDVAVARNGSVSVFMGNGVLDLGAPDVELETPLANARLAWGDVDGDGHDDLLVAWTSTATDATGNLAWYRGQAGGLVTPADLTLLGLESQGLGVEVSVGDVDFDTFEDVLVVSRDGRADLLPGTATGLGTPQLWSLVAQGALSEITGARIVGDVNGDGFADIVVGRGDEVTRSQCELFLGAVGGPSSVPAWSLVSERSAELCSHARGLGDVNGDGLDDVVIEDGLWDYGVYLGDALAGLSSEPVWSVDADVGSAWPAGDIDGDGYADMAYGNGHAVLMSYGHPEKGLSPVVARAGGPYVGAVSEPLDVDASTSSGTELLSATWDCDDDGTFDVDGLQATCAYETAGIHPLRVRVSDLGGAWDEAVTEVFVDIPTVALTDAEAEEGRPVTLVPDVEGGDAPSWRYDCGAGWVVSTTPDFTCTFDDEGTYGVQLEVTAGNHVFVEEATVEVVNVPPTLTLEPSATLDEGGVLSVMPQVDDPGVLDVIEVLVDCDVDDVLPPVAVTECGYPQDGLFVVRVTASDGDGGEVTKDQVVQVVNLAPEVEAGPDLEAEAGQPVELSGTFDDLGVEDLHVVTWQLGDGGVAEGLDVTHTYEEVGTFTATLIVEDDEGAIGLDTLSVKVVESPSASTDTGPASPDLGTALRGARGEGTDSGCGCASSGPTSLWFVLPLLPGLLRRRCPKHAP